jgi:hypothetical protein
LSFVTSFVLPAPKKPTNLVQRPLQGIDTRARAACIGLLLGAVSLPMALDQLLERGRLLLETGQCAAPLFGGVARQFHPIDGKHLLADQAQLRDLAAAVEEK